MPVALGVSRHAVTRLEAGVEKTARLADRTAVLALLEGSRAWLADAHTALPRLARTGFPLTSFENVADLTVLRTTLEPNGPPAAEPPDDSSLRAHAALREVERLQLVGTPQARSAALRMTEHAALWLPMQTRGLRLDLDLLTAQRRTMDTQRAEAAARLGLDLLDESDAGHERTHAWLAELGIKARDREGKPSLAREDLQHALVPANPEAAARWAEFRAARSLASHLGKVHELSRLQRGGRVYPEVRVAAQRSGRTTISRPALQNVTAASRPLLVADAGMVLVSLDFSQAEPRTAAAISGDTVLAADLEAGLYERLMAELGLTRPEAKTALLAVLYGQGAPSLAARLGVPVERAAAVIAGLWSRYPMLAAFNRELRTRWDDLPPLASGRPAGKPRGPWAALNAYIQGTAADALYEGIARVAGVLGAEALWLQVHDELIVQVPEAEAEHARAVLQREMTLDLPGEAQILGARWGK